MNDPLLALQAMLRPASLQQTLFPQTSRYAGIDTATLTKADGKVTVYIRRRFLPQPEALALQQEHTVAAGDRLDNVTALYLGDPEQFWRLCDANAGTGGTLRPAALTEVVGRRLRITLPAGIQGGSDA